MRAFIAIHIPVEEQLQKVLVDIKHNLSTSKCKWVDFDVLHLTIAFLGDTKNNIISKIQTDVENKLNNIEPFQLKIAGVGIFGTKENPTVIWSGVEHNTQLLKIQKINYNIVEQYVSQPYRSTFQPHITIGRIKQVADIKIVNDLIQKYQNQVFQTVLCNKIIMYQSILTSNGALYKPLFEQKLTYK